MAKPARATKGMDCEWTRPSRVTASRFTICLLALAFAACGIVDSSSYRNGRIACAMGDGISSPQSYIYSFMADGSDMNLLTPGAYPAWSRDGQTIWFTLPTSTSATEIWSMNAGGTNQRRALTFGGPAGTPTPSPDGTRVAFTGAAPGVDHLEVWVMNADGSDARQLTTTTMFGTARTGMRVYWSVHPSWSADGQKIAYASTQSGSSQIWVMGANGKNPTQLTFGNGADYPDSNVPEYSLDGRSIVFWSGFETEYGDVWVMDADGRNPRRITSNPEPVPRSSDNPTWSPDGQWVVFISNRSGGLDALINAWIAPKSGGAPRALAAKAFYCGWQPLR